MITNDNYLFDSANDDYKYDSDAELGDKITELSGRINAAAYCFLKMVAAFDCRKGWCDGCIKSCSHWLNWKCGMTFTTAREKLRVAHCLENLPHINKAFESGLVSYSKVRAMTRIATDDNEEILLSVAMGGTANDMDKLIRRYQRVDENQNPIEQEDEYQQRKLNYYQDNEGMWVLRTRLPQVEGGLLIKAIEEIMRQEDRNASAEAPKKGRLDVPAVEKASYSQRRADAMSVLVEHFIATATVDDENGGAQPLAGHERCQVVLHLNVDTLKAEHEHQHELDHEHGESCSCNHDSPANMDYQWISMANAKRFSSDASLYTVLEDKYGNVLNLSRKTRTITTALGRALHIRDETCRFPGCCANKYVDFHHIQHWGNGGKTEPDNLIKLCRFHHSQLHKGHFTILLQRQTYKNYGQKWIFKNAEGEVIEPCPLLAAPRSRTGIKDFMEAQWPQINSQTGVSHWQGKPLNYSKAIGDLIRCKHRHRLN